jgi:hypothetical protein
VPAAPRGVPEPLPVALSPSSVEVSAMPPRRSQGDSNRGLVITLVICILLILGLGVTTYYGFALQEDKDKEVKKAQAELNPMKAERDWYKYQAWQYRKFLGQDQGIDAGQLANWNQQFDALAKDQKDAPEVKKVVDESREALGDTRGLGKDAARKPKESYKELLTDSRNAFDTLEKRNEQLEKDKKALEKKVKDREDELAQAAADFKKGLDALNEKGVKDQSTDRATIDELKAKVLAMGADWEKKVKDSDEARSKVEKESKKKDAQIRQRDELIQQKSTELLSYKKRSEDAPTTLRTDWKIVRMDTRGTMPYINLGSADRVRPQLTFSIYGISPDGRPSGAP